jgi:hypothetical protein
MGKIQELNQVSLSWYSDNASAPQLIHIMAKLHVFIYIKCNYPCILCNFCIKSKQMLGK